MIETISGIGPSLKFAGGALGGSIPPTAPAAGTVNGTGIDRLGLSSAVIEVETGAVTGGPTTQTLDVKIQHSDTLGSGYVDFVPGATGSGAVAQLTAINTRKKKSIDLRAAKRYVRLVAVTAFTGGAAPTWFQSAKLVFGGAESLPAQADD